MGRPIAKASSAPKDSQGQSWKLWVSIGAIALLMIIAKLDDAEKSSSRRSEDLRTDACVNSHVYMNRLLKAPATAKYPACSGASVTNLGGDKWRVQSYVDSQNGFGALIRTQYTMELQHLSGSNWQYLSVITNP